MLSRKVRPQPCSCLHVYCIRHHALGLYAGERTLSEVFQLFGVIHQVTTDHAILTRITQEVIEDFAADNVQYLELRTTPKVLPGHPVHFLARWTGPDDTSDIAFPGSSIL